MDIIVKDTNVLPIAVVDLYSSFLWSERYIGTGDFILKVPLDSNYLDYLAIGNYLTLADSDRAMIIQQMEISSAIDTGKRTVVYKGETLEVILKRRIVWGIEKYQGRVESVIRTLLNKNAINPANTARKIPNLVYIGPADSVTTAYLASLDPIAGQFEGENLFDAIKSLCEQANLGFKITFNNAGKFEFRLYYGTDRSIQQTARDPIVFSPEYDTLVNSRYVHSVTDYKNVALVAGESQNDTVIYGSAHLEDSEPTGLSRREMYVSASDMKSEDFGAQYTTALQYRGLLELQDNSTTGVFDGEVDTVLGPKFGSDYYLGDFVYTVNEYGLGSVAQVTEYIRSHDENGYSAYPTFVMLN